MPHHDLADAVNVGIVDADFDAVGHRHAGRVGIDLALGMQRVGPQQLGLAVERAQRHAHGLEELEGLGPECRAAGCGRTQAGEAEAVAQRAEQDRVGKAGTLALFERGKPALHADVEQALLERRCVHHPGADVGGDRFPHARRKQHERRRDLAQIVHHGLGLFDEVDLHPAQEAFAEHIDLLHDPGQRQHRDVFVVRPLRIEGADRSRNGRARGRRRASRALDARWCLTSCRGSRRPRPWSHPRAGRKAPARA